MSVHVNERPLKCLKRFEESESVGTEIYYRCVRCRGCTDCTNGERIDCISIQEEVEQTIIEKSVNGNLDKGCTVVKLPFLCDPVKKLAPNKHQARKIYDGQLKKLDKNQQGMQDVIMSERKLQELGFL